MGGGLAGRLEVVVGASIYSSVRLRRGTKAVIDDAVGRERGSGGREAGSGMDGFGVGVTSSWVRSMTSGEESIILLGDGGGGVDGSKGLIAGVR